GPFDHPLAARWRERAPLRGTLRLRLIRNVIRAAAGHSDEGLARSPVLDVRAGWQGAAGRAQRARGGLGDGRSGARGRPAGAGARGWGDRPSAGSLILEMRPVLGTWYGCEDWG